MTVLFVVATIIVFLVIDAIYRRLHQPINQPITTAVVHHAAPRTPEGIFFARSHTWLNLLPSGRVHLGIDDLVSGMLEKPNVVFLGNPGESIRKGDPILAIREGDRRLTIASPLDGKIVSVNDELSQHPDAWKSSSFSNGWVYNVQPNRLSDVKQFLLGAESRTWMQTELSRLRDFLMEVMEVNGHVSLAGTVLQDGGLPSSGLMSSFDDQTLERFQREFLSVTER